MKNLNTILTPIILIVAIVILLFLWNRWTEDLNTEFNKYKNAVGEKVVFQKDTLMIIDYSLIRSTVIMEDGKEISIQLFEQIVIKE